ncbi:ankyrin repeat-containing domain protein [Tribonema minus]|uniref:Ankyrin repeat-containing domain protein n=1 Tax=Tribonema minus TaxID=303371 RepID=A0A836CCE0_9STRA|nr:ankyrin repeat-containing domain protein [Tribonema minus]
MPTPASGFGSSPLNEPAAPSALRDGWGKATEVRAASVKDVAEKKPMDTRWEAWDVRSLRTYLQSQAATNEARQKQVCALGAFPALTKLLKCYYHKARLVKAATKGDLLELVVDWNVGFLTKEEFRAQAAGLGGVRRRVIDVWTEALAGNAMSIQLYVEQGEDIERKLYVDQGEDIERKAPNNRMRRPLHCAVLGKSDACVRILLEGGADVGARDMDKATALHIAARQGKTVAVELLLQHGADALAKLDDGTKPGDKFDDSVTPETRKYDDAVVPETRKEIKELLTKYIKKAADEAASPDGEGAAHADKKCCCVVS